MDTFNNRQQKERVGLALPLTHEQACVAFGGVVGTPVSAIFKARQAELLHVLQQSRAHREKQGETGRCSVTLMAGLTPMAKGVMGCALNMILWSVFFLPLFCHHLTQIQKDTNST